MAAITTMDFSVTLDHSGASPIINFLDTGSYPPGVPNIMFGYVRITQPDGITVDEGSFSSPTIFWTGSAINSPDFALRLANNQSFQNGTHTITYFLRAAGYDDSSITKTFALSYTRPTIILSNSFDIFTPQLSLTDETTYTQSGMTLNSTVRDWSVTIRTVLGTPQVISGSSSTLDLAYLGSYYDSYYDTVFNATLAWTLDSPSGWVTLKDKINKTATYQAQIPPSLDDLLDDLTALKTQVDTAGCICNTGCGCSGDLLEHYLQAEAIYNHIILRGRNGDTDGLSAYVIQLQKLFNNCITPSYTNTNGPIPAYDWGSTTGSVAWTDITGKPSTARIEWEVGDGGFPGNGATTLTTAALVSKTTGQLMVFRGSLHQFAHQPADGDSYFTKLLAADNFITFTPALSTGEKLSVFILAL